MKKFLIIICVFFVAENLAVGAAKNDPRAFVSAADVKMTRKGKGVTVEFTFNVGEKAVKSGHNLIVEPVIKKGTMEERLIPILVRGKRSKVIDARHELNSSPKYGGVRTMPTDTTLSYSATVLYKKWMSGAQLVLEGVSLGCCSSTEVELGLVADNILYSEAEFETKIVEKETVVARSEVKTTAPPREVELVTPLNSGQRLAEQYSFLTSAAGTDLPKQVLENSDDEKVIERALAEARKGSVSIYFKQGVRRIDRVFGNNEKNLHQLITVIQELCAAKDVKIAALIVAGFASPEGSPQLNERLAHARATSVRNYLVANTDVDSTVTRVFNGKADWLGLRELVAKSNMEQRDQIIDIIDNVPIEASMVETEKGTKRIPGRMRQLMRLDGGKPYAFMLNYLFPELRQAAYIKIFYEEK